MENKNYNLIISLLYPAADFTVVVLAILSSYKLYHLLSLGKQAYYQTIYIIPVSLFTALATVFILFIFKAYKSESSVLNMEEIKNVIKGITFSFLFFGILLVFVKFAIPRYVMVLSYIFSMILIVAERTFFYHLPLTKIAKGLQKRVLIYGAGELGTALYREIVNSPKMGIIPIGFIDDNPNKQDTYCYQSGYNTSNGLCVIGSGKDIIRLKQEFDVDEIYVAISNIENSTLINILEYLKSENIKVSFVPNLYKVFIHKVKINKIGEIPIISEEDDFTPQYLYFKRYFDLLLAIILIFLSWPLFVVIALAIKIDSKGPVFFKHDRVGKDSKIFKLYKFRSMFVESDPYTVNPLDQNDPRITKVGSLLRKTSLDELPQIINVLKGNMSFVGPRPEMPFIVEQYDEIHRERLKVMPGITGLWQLSGDRKKAIHENMDYDLYYKRNVSFFLDVAILIETVIFAFRGI